MAEVTPMMRQYREMKEKYSDCILFFRLGDFYEMFDEDARRVSKELDLTLTTRDRTKEDPNERVPMCGVPFHAADSYIARLIQKGYKVAVCEQLEDPALAKGLVERGIVRIVTPGTATDPTMLEAGRSNYLASIFMDNGGSAVCLCDVSTGEIFARSFPPGSTVHIVNELTRCAPSEAIMNSTAYWNDELLSVLQRMNCLAQEQGSRFDYDSGAQSVCAQFKSSGLDELGLGVEPQTVRAVGALLSYIKDAQMADLSQINKLDFLSTGRYMELDVATLRNLELLYSLRSHEKRGSLLGVLDRTRTPMGARMLRAWVSRPLLSPAAINRRLMAVEELFNDNVARPELARVLRGVGDLERLMTRVVNGTTNARDLNALASSIGVIPEVLETVKGMSSPLMRDFLALDPLADIRENITAAICDDPPVSVRDAGMIRDGFDQEVDRLRSLLTGSRELLSQIEARERQRTGRKLKVGYNKVFGYYIEIPRSQSNDLPQDYIRKQTLVNCERFITEELKNLEQELLTAEDRLKDLEYRLFTQLRQTVAESLLRVQDTASRLAGLDVICSFAQCASDMNWVRPEITADGVIDIRDGRHPVVEQLQSDVLFVPNDTYLDTGPSSTAIITGPNMAGKSTYMRQTALIVLMAQMGSFVPARSARICLTDRVFTRIGASDDLSGGLSTFMVEMSEVAAILKDATSRSLIILDEIGRGTSTYDGMAIARAVLEYCADKRRLGAKTMFATHYHELTALEGEVPGVKNFNISAKKRGGEIIFFRKIVPGGADDSYGVEVARLAGVPEPVVKRAKLILNELTQQSQQPVQMRLTQSGGVEQVSLETIAVDEVSQTLRDTDINTITPLEALNLLYELKKKVTK